MREIRAGSRLVERAAALLVDALEQRLRVKPRVSLALSGGRTPWPVFRQMAAMPLDWGRIDVYQVDERVAPREDSARNLTGLCEALLDRVPAVVHAMPVEDSNLDSAAARYAALLPTALDVVHLGLGDDGHTASLVPGDPVVEIEDRRVAVTRPYRGFRRMTLTVPSLNASGLVVWIVSEERKRAALAKLRANDASIPAARIARRRAVLLTDEVPSTRSFMRATSDDG